MSSQVSIVFPRPAAILRAAAALGLTLAGLAAGGLTATLHAQNQGDEQQSPATEQVQADAQAPAAPATAQAQEAEPEKDRRNAELEEARRAGRSGAADPREQAIDNALAAVKADSTNGDLHYKLANAYHDAGYLHSALQHYNESLRIDAGSSRAWVNRGVVLKELNRHDEATSSFQKALEIDPDDSLAYVNLGDELLMLKRYQEAVDQYRTALEKDPGNAAAYYSLAISFAETGMYRDAARAWRKCAELANAGEGEGSDTARRALENAKLMEDIVKDAQQQLEERAKLKQELESKQQQKKKDQSD